MFKLKIFSVIPVSIVVLFLSVGTLSANEFAGEIIDVFGGNTTTIQIEGKHSLKVGNKIDLTYMAGVLPMMIGVYEITTVQGNVVLCKPVSVTIPPDKGMNVTIDKVQGFVLDQPDPGAMDHLSRDPRFTNERSENHEIKFNDQETPDEKVQGDVIEVMGADVRIQLISSGDVQVGFAADLIYVTSAGMEIPVGTWKVTSVNNREVVAAASDKDVKPRAGMKALIYFQKEEVDAQESLSSDIVVDEDGFPEGGNPFNDRASSNKMALLAPMAYLPGKEESPSLQKIVGGGVEEAGEVRKYWLGVEIVDSLDASKQKYADFPFGVIVIAVMPGSVAQRGGLKKGDMIHRINGTGVNNGEHFVDLINRSGGKIKVKIQRDGKKVKKTIILDRME